MSSALECQSKQLIVQNSDSPRQLCCAPHQIVETNKQDLQRYLQDRVPTALTLLILLCHCCAARQGATAQKMIQGLRHTRQWRSIRERELALVASDSAVGPWFGHRMVVVVSSVHCFYVAEPKKVLSDPCGSDGLDVVNNDLSCVMTTRLQPAGQRFSPNKICSICSTCSQTCQKPKPSAEARTICISAKTSQHSQEFGLKC